MTDLILTVLVGTNSEIRLASRSNFGDETIHIAVISPKTRIGWRSKLNFRQKKNREKLSVAVNLRATFSTLDYHVDYRVVA